VKSVPTIFTVSKIIFPPTGIDTLFDVITPFK
jgi:hypothetical protein